MGYRTSEKLPFIKKAPNDDGLYNDFYSEALRRIGCKLIITRKPKKRILRDLKNGRIDFYPVLTETKDRYKYINFHSIGIPSLDVAIVRKETIHINKEKLVLVKPLGAPNVEFLNFKIYRQSPELSISKAIKAIIDKKADIYIDEWINIIYLLSKDEDKTKFKIHYDCCKGLKFLTLGFSKESKLYFEKNNKTFVNVSTSSRVDDFLEAINSMKEDGTTEAIFKHYFKFSLKKIIKADQSQPTINQIFINNYYTDKE